VSNCIYDLFVIPFSTFYCGRSVVFIYGTTTFETKNKLPSNFQYFLFPISVVMPLASECVRVCVGVHNKCEQSCFARQWSHLGFMALITSLFLLAYIVKPIYLLDL
jgi:hypothetical protein